MMFQAAAGLVAAPLAARSVERAAAPSMAVGLVYSTTTGNTETVAGYIAGETGLSAVDIADLTGEGVAAFDGALRLSDYPASHLPAWPGPACSAVDAALSSRASGCGACLTQPPCAVQASSLARPPGTPARTPSARAPRGTSARHSLLPQLPRAVGWPIAHPHPLPSRFIYGDLTGLDLKGKKVAIFGLGDQGGYGDNFCDAMDELKTCFANQGAEIVGAWPTEGYDHMESKSVEGDKFVGAPQPSLRGPQALAGSLALQRTDVVRLRVRRPGVRRGQPAGHVRGAREGVGRPDQGRGHAPVGSLGVSLGIDG